MGAGPTHLLRHGLASRVRALGVEVAAEFAEVPERPGTEIATTFALWREVARRVHDARARGELPVVVSGNCGASIGAVAGVDGVGVVWLDAHGDFNTPETSESGFLDGMALAALVGRCWRPLTASIRGFVPVPEDRVVHVGARALDPEEEAQLDASAVTSVPAAVARADGVALALAPALDALAGRVRRVHLHVDLDVLDPLSAGRANGFTPDGGLTAADVAQTAKLVRDRFELVSATLSAYDPSHDARAGVFGAALVLLETIAGA